MKRRSLAWFGGPGGTISEACKEECATSVMASGLRKGEYLDKFVPIASLDDLLDGDNFVEQMKLNEN